MKRSNELKPQTVGSFLKKLQDKQYASDQIARHNQRQDTVKLKTVGGEIFKQQSSGGYVPLKMHYSLDHRHSAELNALNAINAVKVTGKNYAGLFPTISQLYELERRPQEKAIIEDPRNIINITPEGIFSQNLKNQLIAHKEESIRQYESHAQQYQLERSYELYAYYERIKQQELIEIEWLQLLCRTNQNFFSSTYVKNLGLVFNYGDLDGQGNAGNNANNSNQNQPENLDDEEAMLQELRAQMDQMKKELAEKDNALAEKDNVIEDKTQKLLEEENKNSDLSDKLASEKILTNELTEKLGISEEKNGVLQSKLDESQIKVRPLEEKLLDLKQYTKQLEGDKVDLRETQKDMREVQKMLIEDKKMLLVDKKLFQDLAHEQAAKISELELVHCNIPGHEYEVIKLTGDMSTQTTLD